VKTLKQLLTDHLAAAEDEVEYLNALIESLEAHHDVDFIRRNAGSLKAKRAELNRDIEKIDHIMEVIL
jgi:hypothetical protein